MIKIIGTIIGSVGFGILFTYLDFIVVIGIALVFISCSFFIIDEIPRNKKGYQPIKNDLCKPPKGSSGVQKPKSEPINVVIHNGVTRTIPRANYKPETTRIVKE